ncbi:hypothetical protein [Sinorhizobium fredii]|jgi:hypothetical protein|uniref:hypothetical protein n=1 Tax=Rhizobium fredii TaxID=380 RepID=UPI0011817BCB|nr:hypothetical protein [Sinorhizobium fredii]
MIIDMVGSGKYLSSPPEKRTFSGTACANFVSNVVLFAENPVNNFPDGIPFHIGLNQQPA